MVLRSQAQQKTAQVDDVVAFLPGVAQVALAQPGFEMQRIEPGQHEIEPGWSLRTQSLNRAQAVVADVKVDVLPGVRQLRLLVHGVVCHAGDTEAPVGQTVLQQPIGKSLPLRRHHWRNVTQQLARHHRVVGAGQQHAWPGAGFVCRADAGHTCWRAGLL